MDDAKDDEDEEEDDDEDEDVREEGTVGDLWDPTGREMPSSEESDDILVEAFVCNQGRFRALFVVVVGLGVSSSLSESLLSESFIIAPPLGYLKRFASMDARLSACRI
jgi:hypothetical protein